MSISLTPEQLAWLSARVAQGDFASVEDAARQLIDERIAERVAEEVGDLAWAKSYVDEALAQMEQGRLSASKSIVPAAKPFSQRSRDLFDRSIQTPGVTASGHHGMCLIA